MCVTQVEFAGSSFHRQLVRLVVFRRWVRLQVDYQRLCRRPRGPLPIIIDLPGGFSVPNVPQDLIRPIESLKCVLDPYREILFAHVLSSKIAAPPNKLRSIPDILLRE